MAALRSPRCEVCGHLLTDMASIEKGFGPDCTDKRAAFYAAAGLSVAAVDRLAACHSADVARWLHSMKFALREGEHELARIYFNNAQLAVRTLEQLAAGCLRRGVVTTNRNRRQC